ncbi:DNA cytosine methyltransferase [Bradyrhizobium sp. I71]|uniref:DNA cytosine methyltransferase n=1 Tax=Bradyrhizobium sp. I71 TaxID=2590772 RepID=UPI001EF8A084|nr:DNA cytosine methyltransferase [Bradyrhizobium sp. I71]ULL01231.1 DNA cytosine methyltransferase [Bradyrhizobium sp. I71]
MARPLGIDLFAGAGGMSLGFEQAGFDVVAAVEIDPVHAAVHEFNFPKCATIAQSVSSLTGADIRRMAKIGDRPVDVVFGGAPCQGFSMIGQRALEDPRNALVRDFVRIVTELEARYFVFENVKGLTIGKHRAFLDELIQAFESAGYELRLPWKVLNAASFGVPQNRERLILMGARRGLKVPEYPPNKTRAAGTPADLENLPEGPSCEDALSDLPDAETFLELLEADAVKVRKWPQGRSSYARMLRGLDNESNYFGYPREWVPSLLTSSLRTDHSDISRRRFKATREGEVEPISRFFKLPRRGVSNTLRAGTDASRGAFTSPRPLHYEFARCITVREMARLHGFPDWFRFHQTKWHGARQIGNSVPPLLAMEIARRIIKALGARPTRPRAAIALGDPQLLNLDMAEAARFWGVAPPIGKRNQKSGAKKRSQIEIENQLSVSGI